jgi:hypothetical protein
MFIADSIKEAPMHPNLIWQLAKIHQAEALKEAAERQTRRSAEDNRPNGQDSRLIIMFATSILVVIPLVWMFAAG